MWYLNLAAENVPFGFNPVAHENLLLPRRWFTTLRRWYVVRSIVRVDRRGHISNIISKKSLCPERKQNNTSDDGRGSRPPRVNNSFVAHDNASVFVEDLETGRSTTDRKLFFLARLSSLPGVERSHQGRILVVWRENQNTRIRFNSHDELNLFD